MVNEFNYLTLRELFLIRIRHFDHLDVAQKFKVMWAIDEAKKLQAKVQKQNLRFYFKNADSSLVRSNDDSSIIGEKEEIIQEIQNELALYS